MSEVSDVVEQVSAPEEVASPVSYDESISSASKDLGVPAEFLQGYVDDDPSYGEAIKKNSVKKSPVSDQSKTDDVEDTNSDDSIIKDTGDDKSNDSEPKDAEDKNSSTEGDDDFEFADNVIEGLKGEHLKALPNEAKEALASFYSKSSETSEKAKKMEAQLADLLKDPIVKQRSDMLLKGQREYGVRGITADEKRTIVQRLQDKIGLTEDEANDAFNELEPGLNAVAKERAENIFHNRSLEENSRRQVDEQTTSGRQLLLNLGKFNKEFAFKETNPNNFWKRDDNGSWVLNESHPEIKGYQSKVVPILSAFAKTGMTYESLNKMAAEFGEEAVYAMAAKKHGLPVAINTKARDQKIIQTELRKKLSPFLKNSSVSAELSSESQSSTGKKSLSGNSVIKNGYDISKLATDADYYERALTEKQGDLNWAKRVSALADEGAVYNRSKRK